MQTTIIYGPGDIRFEERPDPQIQAAGDAVVRVVRSCVCGSDLWHYRGVQPTHAPHPIGHEFIGIVEATGAEVNTVRVGDFVIAPFTDSDGTCVHCRNGITTSCVNFGFWGGANRAGEPLDGAQGQYVRVPFADGTLVKVTESPDEELYPHLLTLADVMSTGHHAARSGNVQPGATVVVVGDGAVGLCAVLAAKRLGAERIIAMSRHEDRQRLAQAFGATDIVAERGDDGIAAIEELLGGIGADSVLECVGTKDSMHQALGAVRPGGYLGFVGVPAGAPELPMRQLFNTNIHIAGGMATVRPYLDELLPDVLSGAIEPGQVFDLALPLDQVADAYAAMDQRKAIKVLLEP
ncbi:zinc-dependent alcohol dehydrogenase family protein [Mycobacterium sp. CBMA293]|uniref:zinc-dependent alcohol dehydrogenase family protein n=1 Tax=unclassified Mycolicibacterium TaxID=2636767 RepID=UPI0013276EB9|nr:MULTISPECIES: zinc-dependent alcohol dehydrogenase family protein [unclassified Mycolicibacterium]MUL47331.1 zinc-dependent alcohol dehydrogenase family protein [Mycolicibacterium sp. CBMA 360]MUL96346.1 zinc-dependent alcohol dehydrogenase family protein [Mycolicibacterium sp. CBMA 230]MUM30518.1 zinc-dependent alcohol dehydrogenase family protein [Mycolicibacterium sp. CBMA 361]MUL61444.1 zinc-dependent alcohol dehydrogenase family protein [Mycolicibacterium sp. CBMA 335]MUL72179.1 zinc-d